MNSHGMHETGDEPYFYSNYTWKELRDLPAQRRVVLLPVGSTEDHGHHLPLDTDNYPQSEITNRQGAKNAKTRRAHWGKQTELRKAP
jgi:creatinine amidohydrolase/Fe(II)-dependent formamide hydrolase-like protein